tara:strand:+ start:748 stop:1848 length:1101 start_codon:yes stop_codon:yes gene_type:complete
MVTKVKLKPRNFLVYLAGFLLFSCSSKEAAQDKPELDIGSVDATTPVWDLLEHLGETPPSHRPAITEQALIETGRQLVHSGKSESPATGEMGVRISAYFYCTDCHTVSREESSLARISDPETKLDYLIENNIPLLQGSTFAGMVNRESWYNGDYARKYRFSPAVRAARTSLTKAIELCSRECSQGRDPEDWEMQAMVAYFWSLQWTLGDLGFTTVDLAEMKRRSLNPTEFPSLIREIQSRFATAAPATFGSPPADPKVGYSIAREPDLNTGKEVWERSCLHCHGAEGASEHYFKDKSDTWASLNRKFGSESKKSIYGLIRLGTEPDQDDKAYMPNYPKERLSDAQIEDLRAFISSKAEESATTSTE